METRRKQNLGLENKSISFLTGMMKELSLQMDYHFKFDDEEFWQALDESIEISKQIRSKTKFERCEYLKTIEHLKASVQEIELYEDMGELQQDITYFRHCFLDDIRQNRL